MIKVGMNVKPVGETNLFEIIGEDEFNWMVRTPSGAEFAVDKNEKLEACEHLGEVYGHQLYTLKNGHGFVAVKGSMCLASELWATLKTQIDFNNTL